MSKSKFTPSDLPLVLELLASKPFGKVGVIFGYQSEPTGYKAVVKFLVENGIDPRIYTKRSGGFKKGNNYARNGNNGLECIDKRPLIVRIYRHGKMLIKVYEARYALGIFR